PRQTAPNSVYTSVMYPKFLLAATLSLTAIAYAQPPVQPPAQAPLQVAFTFDDLPAHGPLAPGQQRRDVITSILATLHAEHMPPTYGFINAYRMERFPYQIELLKAWRDAGEPLGNHTYSHKELNLRSAAWYTRDIAANEPVLRKVDPDGDWHWFRYPYLEEGDTPAKRDAVRSWLFAHHYRVAEVSMSFDDYLWNDAAGRCYATHNQAAIATLHDDYLAAADAYITRFRTLSHTLYGRDIPYVLLLHVGSFDAKMLPELISLFRARGFTFVTLQQAESDPAYNNDPGGTLKNGGTMQELLAMHRNINVPEDLPVLQQVGEICTVPKKSSAPMPTH
ncbi:MAG: polysaccharide deacetylase family protein, partial [Bryocella sp.]